MAQYCDSQKLESNWFHWLLSSRTPTLEHYRTLGLLWTKIIDENDADRKTLPNPLHPLRTHCIALGQPLYFNSYDGEPKTDKLPPPHIIDLLSDDPIHRLDHKLSQITQTIPDLQSNNFIRELPTNVTWHAMLEDVNRICHGIALRFKPRSEEEHQELTNDALVQVINKLSAYKLVYTPGRAPVFNLLTTTIYRVMYSIMNRRKTQREGLSKILAEAEAGVLPDAHRSFRAQSSQRRPVRAR